MRHLKRFQIVAEAEPDEHWFNELPKERQDAYIEEHPKSKYAKGRKKRVDSDQPSEKQDTEDAQEEELTPEELKKRKAIWTKAKEAVKLKLVEPLGHATSGVKHLLSGKEMTAQEKEGLKKVAKGAMHFLLLSAAVVVAPLAPQLSAIYLEHVGLPLIGKESDWSKPEVDTEDDVTADSDEATKKKGFEKWRVKNPGSTMTDYESYLAGKDKGAEESSTPKVTEDTYLQSVVEGMDKWLRTMTPEQLKELVKEKSTAAALSTEQDKLLVKLKSTIAKQKILKAKKEDARLVSKAMWKKLGKKWTPAIDKLFESEWKNKLQTKVSITNATVDIKAAKAYFKTRLLPKLNKEQRAVFDTPDVIWGTLDGFPHLVGDDWETVYHFVASSAGKVVHKSGWKSRAARSEFYTKKIAKLYGIKLTPNDKKAGATLNVPKDTYWTSKTGRGYPNIVQKTTNTKPDIKENLDDVLVKVLKKGQFYTAYGTNLGNTRVVRLALTKWVTPTAARKLKEGSFPLKNDRNNRTVHWQSYILDMKIKEVHAMLREKDANYREYKREGAKEIDARADYNKAKKER